MRRVDVSMKAGAVCTLTLALLASHAAAAGNLTIGDVEHPPGCSKAAWAGIAQQLHQAAGERAPDRLEALARTYVCGEGTRAEQALLRAAPRFITQVLSGTGEDTTTRLVESRGTIAPHAGRAWDTTVRDDHPEVSLSFFVDEACVHGAAFRPFGSGWMLVRVEDACD